MPVNTGGDCLACSQMYGVPGLSAELILEAN